MDIIRKIGMLFAFLACSQVVASPSYITPQPLDKTIKTSIGEVRGSQVQLPIITWGADIATIYANGDAKKNQSNSIFKSFGLSFKLSCVDDFSKQVENYIQGKTPYLRGTLGMINAATDVLAKNSKIAPVIIYQLTWSAGGDALVVKPNIQTIKDLKGKTIALQTYGPHVDYMVTLLADAGLKPADVEIKWLPDLTGTDNSPMAALYEKDIDAVFVIIPDALALTSGGNTGDGSEDSVKGARILISTKTASRVIADVYAVRADYLRANHAKVEAFVKESQRKGGLY